VSCRKKIKRFVDYEFTRGKLEPWYHVNEIFKKKEKIPNGKTSTDICLLFDWVTLAIKQGQQTAAEAATEQICKQTSRMISGIDLFRVARVESLSRIKGAGNDKVSFP